VFVYLQQKPLFHVSYIYELTETLSTYYISRRNVGVGETYLVSVPNSSMKDDQEIKPIKGKILLSREQTIYFSCVTEHNLGSDIHCNRIKNTNFIPGWEFLFQVYSYRAGIWLQWREMYSVCLSLYSHANVCHRWTGLFAFHVSLNVVASKWHKRFLLNENNFDINQGQLKVDQPKNYCPLICQIK